MLNTLGSLWCSIMHHSMMWPIHGQYKCRTCGRFYPVPWGELRAAPSDLHRHDSKDLIPNSQSSTMLSPS